MFPIIPARATPAQATVVAGEDLPALASTDDILLEDILRARPPHRTKTKCEVMVREGRLRCGAEGWVRALRLAPDCHSVDLVARAAATSSAVRLQAARELVAGRELRLWFDDACLAAAGVPFLAPRNIQGEKNYVCHLCGERFEFPNPLKIHLALDCGARRRAELWRRLCGGGAGAAGAAAAEAAVPPIERVYDMRLKRDATAEADSSEPENLSTSAKSAEDRPSSEPTGGARYSAFKPYLALLKGEGYPMVATPPPPLLAFPGVAAAQAPFPHAHAHAHAHARHLLESQANRRAVEMETLVSNMGRSKQGHLCIYCGKVYSRKYGLKIHIRTHTGFKPLKCKVCLRPFGDPSNLNKHVRLHSEGETPYKCEECGKVLVRRRDLDRHMKSRHQECTTT